MKKLVFFMVSALAVVLCSSCDQQAEQQLQTSVLGNYCEVTVLAYGGSAVHSYAYDYSNIVISYEGGSGTNFGTYMVPQQGDVTVSWTCHDAGDSYDCSETFNVGSAVKMTIVVDGSSSAFANY
ncbi:MAG: hypothetical protein PUD89_05940 [Bacteroidales bacterium]|nr:hypothetical protein [Bacteroidales bacterium]